MDFEQALAAQDEFLDAGGNSADPAGPIYKYVALKGLESLEKSFNDGNKLALMHAIRECANHELIMPTWVSNEYIKAFDTVNHFRAKSWDEVFGKPLRKNANLAALRKRDKYAVHIWNAVRASEQQGIAINDELFESIGKNFGLGLTLTKEFYSYFRNQTL